MSTKAKKNDKKENKKNKKARSVSFNKIHSAEESQFEGKDKLDTQEAHVFLGCSLPLVYNMIRDGRIKKKHIIGNRMYLEKAELKSLKDSGAVQPRKKHNTASVVESLARRNGEVKMEISIPAADFQVINAFLLSQNLKIEDYVSDWVKKMIAEKVKKMKESSKNWLEAI